MNIQSKAFTLRYEKLVGYIVSSNKYNQSTILTNVPDHYQIALMSEQRFDHKCGYALVNGEFPND